MIFAKKQQGFSLVELMIAITLGMVLMGASLQFIVSTRQTYDINDDVARIQENGRIALDILVNDLQFAGYRTPLNGDGKVPNFFLMDCTTGANSSDACLLDGEGVGGAINNSDRLAIQFDPPPDDGTETDCLGNAIAATTTLVNVYTIDAVTADGSTINSLFCRGFNADTGLWISARQPLVDGIDSMQVLYRVTTPSTTTSNVQYSYVPADQITPADWPYITAARVALLVSNGLATGSAEAQVRNFQLLDSAQITFPSTDRHPRRIYSTTVQFNNQTTPGGGVAP